MEKTYNPIEIETRWRKAWKENNHCKVDLAKSKKKYYLLVEFTYPSGDLHMGHWFAFALPDILARFKRMNGFEVFAPNGFDAFGLPAENAAIVRGVHPKDWTYANIKRMKKQFATMGAIYDWEHEVITSDADFYRWNQWIFLKMLEKGLAYRGKALANWCPKDKTVLANENVENGKCWRCGEEIVQKEVDQWFLKITDYADKLLWKETGSQLTVNSSQKTKDSVNIELKTNNSLDWPKSIRDGQNNWIGRSEGVEIRFSVLPGQFSNSSSSVNQSVSSQNPRQTDKPRTDKLKSDNRKPKTDNLTIGVFTTRSDTLFGATFLVLAPEHPLVEKLIDEKHQKIVKEYQKISSKRSELDRKEAKEKTGVFTGLYAINPLNQEKIPVWIADYALAGYGTGALFGDAHDERDVEFAKKYGIRLKPTLITGDERRDRRILDLEEVFTGDGKLVNSGHYSGLTSAQARKEITAWLEKSGYGKASTTYHLHDWSISRQRYWGTPIPIIYCENCGTVPVPETDLPVELPYQVYFDPKGKPPLATAKEWVKVKCPNCGQDARREVETMDTFVDSAWYFLAYLRDTTNRSNSTNMSDGLPWDPQLVKTWMPVDVYFGGAEHTLGHTLYSRFFVKFLQDLGVLPLFAEYASKRVNHGVILGPDGSRMSKSRGNVVNPDVEVKKYGADAVRLYLAFLGPYDLVAPWNPSGIKGIDSFLKRVWRLVEEIRGKKDGGKPTILQSHNPTNLKIMHKTIKKVSEDIEANKFNTAIAALMTWLNELEKSTSHSSQLAASSKKKSVNREPITVNELETFLLLLAPFAPYVSEELWQRVQLSVLGGQLSDSSQSVNQLTSSVNLRKTGRPKTGQLKSENRKQKTDNWSVHSQPWPRWDPALIVDEKITLVIQVNGRVRETIEVDKGTSKKQAEKIGTSSQKISKWLEDKNYKVVFVPGKLINFVIS